MADFMYAGLDGGRNDPSSDSGELVWEDRARTLTDIVTKGKYPCLLKLRLDDLRKLCPGVRVTQTPVEGLGEEECVVKALEMRRYKMVAAMKLHWDRRSMEYHETGKQIDINITQKGINKILNSYI